MEGVEKWVVTGSQLAPKLLWYVVNIAGGILHRVVQHSVHDFLVGTGVGSITIEDFTHTIDASSLVESGPEVLLDVLDCVNTETINCTLLELDTALKFLLEKMREMTYSSSWRPKIQSSRTRYSEHPRAQCSSQEEKQYHRRASSLPQGLGSCNRSRRSSRGSTLRR